MQDDDVRVREHVDALLEALPDWADGHQRELPKVLQRMALTDEQA